MSVFGGFFVAVPPAGHVSPRIRWRDGSCVHLKRRGSKRAFFGGGRNSFLLSFLTILFLAGKHQRRLFDPTCVSLRDPHPEKSVARLHTHTPCPPCLDWFSVRILEGITAICRLLRNKGDSSLSSLQYFRGITRPDKHALAPLYICSLFCFDLSTHPNCPLYLKADHIILLYPRPALWIEATHQFLESAHHKNTNMSQCLIKVVVLKTSKVEAGHGACYLVTSCISLACISALKVSMFYEHSHFPVGNHHSQLFEGVMGTRISAGMPKCGYGLQAHCQLVLSRWRGSRMHSHWVTWRVGQATWPDVWLQWVGLAVWEHNYFMWKIKPAGIHSCLFITSY